MTLNDTSQIPKLSGIYKIVNIENNKSYIGSAVNLKIRINRHYYELINHTHNNQYLLRSFIKYGKDAFKIELLEVFKNIEYSELLRIEKEYIEKYDTLNNGYNLMIDNASFLTNLNKTKEHIENNRNRNSREVYAFNIDTGLKEYYFKSITEASLFFKTSSSNISQVCKNKLNYMKGYTFCYVEDYDENKDYRKPRSRKGIKLSEKHREKLQLLNQKRLGKKIYKYSLKYELLNIYNSMSEAERLNNLPHESLRRRHDNKTPFEGYYWLSNKK